MIERDDIDAVIICTPPKFHEEITVAYAKAGKHILCEKPIARNLEEADRMIEETKKTGVKLASTNHYVDQMKNFISCIREDKTPEVSGEEGRRDLAVVQAAYESAKEGRVVELVSV